MPYTHFGKQADVFKHLALCESLNNEKPQIYVETNSAYAEYTLSHTPEQEYGIYHFMDKAAAYEELKNSTYFHLESAAMERNCYSGSPGLAMNILGRDVNKYTFFDIEEEPLKNIEAIATRNRLNDKVETICRDSISGVMELLPSLPTFSFLHIDPYEIDKPGENGHTYFDVLIKATQLGLKCFLWYGFMTLDVKQQLNKFILKNLQRNHIENFTCTELILEIIAKDTIPCNPGILGSGILTTNLSEASNTAILNYSKLLADMYKGKRYNAYKGDLYQESLIPTS